MKAGSRTFQVGFRTFGHRATGEKEPCTTNSVLFSANGDMLTVQGVRVGRILAYCTKDGRHPAFFLADLQKSILDRSALIRRMSAQDVFREFTGYFEKKSHLADGYLSRFRSARELLLHVADLTENYSDLLYTMDELSRDSYLLLATGDVAVCVFHHSRGSGDEVWAFKGSNNLQILRPHQNAFKLGGHCLNSLITNDFELDEEFFSQRKVENIDLI